MPGVSCPAVGAGVAAGVGIALEWPRKVANFGAMQSLTSSSRLRLRLFGPLQVERDGAAFVPPASRKTRAILGYLALSPRAVGRQRLCDMFFDLPDDPRASLRWSLSKLRPLVDAPGHPRLISERDALRLGVADASIDALQVLALAAADPEIWSEGDCVAALDAMQGPLLEDCELPDRPEFTAWLAAQRQDFHTIAMRFAQWLVDRSVGAERIACLRRLVALDPLDGSATATLAHALVAAGRRDEAHVLVSTAERQLRLAGLPATPSMRLALRADVGPVVAHEPAAAAPLAERLQDQRISVAVLPFVDHGAGVLPAAMVDGLPELLVHMISRFRDIRVVSHRATLGLGGGIVDPVILGAALGASHLVGGSVLAKGGTIRARYNIISATDGALVSSGEIVHSGPDPMALLDEVNRPGFTGG